MSTRIHISMYMCVFFTAFSYSHNSDKTCVVPILLQIFEHELDHKEEIEHLQSCRKREIYVSPGFQEKKNQAQTERMC